MKKLIFIALITLAGSTAKAHAGTCKADFQHAPGDGSNTSFFATNNGVLEETSTLEECMSLISPHLGTIKNLKVYIGNTLVRSEDELINYIPYEYSRKGFKSKGVISTESVGEKIEILLKP